MGTWLEDCEFESETLKSEVLSAAKQIVECFGLELDESCRPDDGKIFARTELYISVPYLDEYMVCPAADFFDLVQDGHGKWDGLALEAKKSAYVCVRPANLDAEMLIRHGREAGRDEIYSCAYQEEEHQLKLSLSLVPTPAVLAIVKSGQFEDEYYPPFIDAHICVHHGGGCPRATIDSAVASYLFELSASCNFTFELSSRSTERDDDVIYEDADKLLKRGERLRPLVSGAGVEEAVKIFVRAAGASEPRHAIIDYAQVVEYVSVTAARIDNFKELRHKLLSPRALQPDARYLSELKQLVDGQNVWSKDAHALRMTIRMCCDAIELKEVAPAFCTLSKLGAKSSEKDRTDALDDLAERISATRNALSHAKANYVASGAECEPSSYPEFSRICRAVAEQAIRWFATQEEGLRTVELSRSRR